MYIRSVSGMSEIAACPPLLLLMKLQPYHLPPPLPSPVSNSSCLFVQCQPLFSSCCTILLCFSRFCIIGLKMFSLFFLCFFFNISFVCCAVLAQSLQSYPTFCDPMHYSPPGSSVHGISRARILEWVAISSSRGSSPSRH